MDSPAKEGPVIKQSLNVLPSVCASHGVQGIVFVMSLNDVARSVKR